jgi:plastocyanin
MDKTLFYVFGITLVVSAFGVAFVGIRFTSFPPTRLAVGALVAYFAALVAATTTFAVLNARDEQNEREAEEAAAAEQPPAGETTTSGATTTGTITGAPQGKETTVSLSAEPDTIAYDTKQLTAKRPGRVTIDLDNPSAVTHDVCLEAPSGDEIGCSNTVAQSNTSLSADLDPGKYTFYCSVDQHRPAGMEGTLTVK